MMSMIMFAIIGAVIDAPIFYWICFGIYVTCKVIVALCKIWRIENGN